MASPKRLTQRNRDLAITTPLGPDVLFLKSFTGTEQLGRLFQFDLELLSEDPELSFEKIIGEKVSVRLTLPGAIRFFHGVISRFVQEPQSRGHASYRATMVPWLWLLTRSADCRIFQGKTVPEILEEVFRGRGFDQFEVRLSGNYAPRDYCVQYRETDFNFVSRLMEHEGIYYYFKHELSKHTLVLADSAAAHDPCPGYEEVSYLPPSEGAAVAEHIRSWTINKELLPTGYVHRDFDFKRPNVDLQAQQHIPREHAAGNLEIFDYPGDYREQDEGDAYAKIRIEEIQSRYETIQGSTDARGLCAGGTVTVSDLPREDQNRKYLMCSTSFSIQSDPGESSAKEGGQRREFFGCSFTCIDAEVPYHPARITPKPLVQGPQTAIVVGAKGEEIHTDEHGRVKVLFHWDRNRVADDTNSCWIRVAQAWAGRRWGAIHIPRIDQEVIVEFLEGDPDRPIITGSVYNGECAPPLSLPAEKTRSTLKSNSSQGGGGCNEIMFEDKKGEEQVFLHAEKDFDLRVKNDAKETVEHDRHLIVKNDQFEQVDTSRHVTVGKSHFEKIGEDHNLDVAGKQAIHVAGSQSMAVDGDLVQEAAGNQSLKVGGKVYINAAGDLVIESGSNITLKVGGSNIEITSGKVAITSAKIEAKAEGEALVDGANVTVNGKAQVSVKGPLAEVNASGVLTLKGGLVKIN